MELSIETQAFELTFRMLLTCGCPVTPDEERRLFDLLVSSEKQASLSYDRILAIFPPHSGSPFHRIRDFYVWQAPAHQGAHLITRDLIIRHFASSFHWDQAVARGLEEGYGQIRSIAPWFVSHMLLPARVVLTTATHVSLSYDYPGGSVLLKNLFLPNDDPKPMGDEMWAVHFAGLLGRLPAKEEMTARFMLDQNAAFRDLRREVAGIDYLDFERKGDYAAFCRSRYKRYYA